MIPRTDGARLVALIAVLRFFAVFALLTGGLDVALGTKLLLASGADLPAHAAADPLLNSQIRYWGAVWCGFGAVLWWTTGDLLGRVALLQILMATVFLGGIGRLLSAFQFGAGPPMLTVFIAIELLGPPALDAWRRRLVRRHHSGGDASV